MILGKIFFLCIFIQKVKVTPLNQFRELQIFRLFSCQNSCTGNAETGIEILCFCSAHPLTDTTITTHRHHTHVIGVTAHPFSSALSYEQNNAKQMTAALPLTQYTSKAKQVSQQVSFRYRHSGLCLCLSPCICDCICFFFYLHYDFHDIFPKFSMASTHIHIEFLKLSSIIACLF